MLRLTRWQKFCKGMAVIWLKLGGGDFTVTVYGKKLR